MKKIMVLCVSLFLTLSLVACGNQKPSTEVSTETSRAASESSIEATSEKVEEPPMVTELPTEYQPWLPANAKIVKLDIASDYYTIDFTSNLELAEIAAHLESAAASTGFTENVKHTVLGGNYDLDLWTFTAHSADNWVVYIACAPDDNPANGYSIVIAAAKE